MVVFAGEIDPPEGNGDHVAFARLEGLTHGGSGGKLACA